MEDNLGLVTKTYEDLGLKITKYVKDTSNMDDPYTQKCRGLIREIDTNKIVCMPPIKSTNLEDFLAKFDINECTLEEFIDGTMINLFHYKDDWHISTRSSIGAKCRWYSKKHFCELFDECNKIDFNVLDKSYYYTFVLQHPENRIVTDYFEPKLTLVFVGTVLPIESDTLGDTIKSIDIQKEGERISVSTPINFAFNDLKTLKDFVEYQNFSFQGIVIKNGIYRAKIRNPKYNYARFVRGNTKNMKFLFFDVCKNNLLNDYLSFFPEHGLIFKEFSEEFNTMVKHIHTSYMNYHVKKTIKDINQIEYAYRPICYELHGLYKKNGEPITLQKVIEYLNTLPPAKIVFCLNHKNYKKKQDVDVDVDDHQD